MEQNKAIQILVEVALVAQAKGMTIKNGEVFNLLSLEDVVLVKEAIDAFKQPSEGEEVSDDNQED